MLVQRAPRRVNNRNKSVQNRQQQGNKEKKKCRMDNGYSRPYMQVLIRPFDVNYGWSWRMSRTRTQALGCWGVTLMILLRWRNALVLEDRKCKGM